jgi:hypothetical protein
METPSHQLKRSVDQQRLSLTKRFQLQQNPEQPNCIHAMQKSSPQVHKPNSSQLNLHRNHPHFMIAKRSTRDKAVQASDIQQIGIDVNMSNNHQQVLVSMSYREYLNYRRNWKDDSPSTTFDPLTTSLSLASQSSYSHLKTDHNSRHDYQHKKSDFQAPASFPDSAYTSSRESWFVEPKCVNDDCLCNACQKPLIQRFARHVNIESNQKYLSNCTQIGISAKVNHMNQLEHSQIKRYAVDESIQSPFTNYDNHHITSHNHDELLRYEQNLFYSPSHSFPLHQPLIERMNFSDNDNSMTRSLAIVAPSLFEIR